ncbi:efflux RND transporter permease subunit [Tumebacillus sp. DT12]|uniref:Efflux RND transporter permease subunit n=1 Tax=Tumebacillus lacus TaxID=2995335 RepID=A0ABT3X644_9BACL|nr:efflux RND transporter permease subunit [Tumebacillus lacus]MCX7572368.1 efflux RND transporter permease subunit [Tumebacillus lacus]
MVRLTKWVFANKAALLILVVLTMALGLLSYKNLPREMFPAMDAPYIMVTTLAQGYDADTLVSQVVDPMEKALASVNGKKKVTSQTADGYTSINITFDSKVVMKDAEREVEKALSGIRLPEGVNKPNIMALNTSMIPVVDVSVMFEKGTAQDYIDDIERDVIPKLQGVKGVSNASLFGKEPSTVTIKVDQEKLAKAQLPIHMLTGVLQGRNLTAAVGEETLDGKATNLKVVGAVEGLKALEELQLAPNVKLKDVATLETASSSQNLTRINGKDGMLVVISKNSTANAVQVGEDVRAIVAELNEDYKGSLSFDTPFNQEELVSGSVDSMTKEVLMGALFATIVILLFLRNIRMTAITVVSIPLSLAITLWLLDWSGVTLNILTLGAVAVAVGRLVDDSIVVIENIYRRFSEGEKTREVVITATGEVASAITSSTLTTVAVFLPMGLVSGSLSKLLYPFALTITYSLLASLLVALTVIPVMSAGLLKNAKIPEHKPPVRFTKFVEWSLNRKWVPLLVAVLLLVGSVGAYVALPKGAVDSSNKDMINVKLSYPSGTPHETVKQGALDLDKYINGQPGVKHNWTLMGNSDDAAKFGDVRSATTVTMAAIMDKEADVDVDAFLKGVRDQKSKLGASELTAEAQNLMSAGGGSVVTLEIRGNKFDEIKTSSEKVIDELAALDGVTKVESNQKDTKPALEIRTKQDAALSAQELSMQLGMLLNNMPVGQIEVEGKDTTVLLDSGLNPDSVDEIKNLQVMGKTGPVPVSAVADVAQSNKPNTVYRTDGHEYILVSATVDPKRLSELGKTIQLKATELQEDMPDGVTVAVGGSAEDFEGDMASLGSTMLASIGIVYLIMVITFKALRTPLAILFTLPLAAIGAMIGIILSGVTIDSTVAIGALMLIGIVVTNAIVLLDRVKQNEETMPIREALLEATATRMRPIVMTAVATVCAMLPLLFGEAETGALVSKGLAVVVIGGLSVATLLTLVIVPVIYELLHFRTARKERRIKAAQPARA